MYLSWLIDDAKILMKMGYVLMVAASELKDRSMVKQSIEERTSLSTMSPFLNTHVVVARPLVVVELSLLQSHVACHLSVGHTSSPAHATRINNPRAGKITKPSHLNGRSLH